jgi:hypothetical protein
MNLPDATFVTPLQNTLELNIKTPGGKAEESPYIPSVAKTIIIDDKD